MQQLVRLEEHLTAVRSRLVKSTGQGEEMLAMFDGITSCLAAIAAEVAMLRQDLKDKDGA